MNMKAKVFLFSVYLLTLVIGSLLLKSENHVKVPLYTLLLVVYGLSREKWRENIVKLRPLLVLRPGWFV
ncbi:unnamed protein product [Brassica rapa]|uniref:Uncharacterized protein n=2 Tax=Brassica TaxID=3705 RepID=A0A8D9GS15_BRACM|nr:unnamed protein product [Brassica napus]CAG7886004.1 unnamed protein product [Brassica rapa]